MGEDEKTVADAYNRVAKDWTERSQRAFLSEDLRAARELIEMVGGARDMAHLIEFLEASKLGSHPAFLRFLCKVDDALRMSSRHEWPGSALTKKIRARERRWKKQCRAGGRDADRS